MEQPGDFHVVEYTVPVLCFVDITTNEVVKIIVDDESIVRTDDVYTETFFDTLDADDPARAKAIDIAEHQAWPSWHQGF